MGIASPSGGDRQQARRPGRVIPFGKYLLLERIAVGGMAEVYMAKSFGIEGFEKILAIKRILPTMAEDTDFIEMFIDEAKIAGQLSHANVAPIYELGKIGDSHYIAMEYVWGKDLLQIMNRFRRLRKKMPAPMVAWVASKMCEALDYAHQKRDRRGQTLNIIHRDVSPQNVLVSYEGEVKLIDFGIAKAASRTTKTQAGVLKGKFGYMSPEQVRGLPIDSRSDIFAVGTCMYEMLTSDRLFMGESDFSTLERVRNAEVTPIHNVVRDIPPGFGEIVMRALGRDPSDRYQTAADLQETLTRFLASQRPPFGTSKLAAWMKTAFATEMAREKSRLDSFAQIGRPSVLGVRRPGGATMPGAGPPPLGSAPAMPQPHVTTEELDAGDLDDEIVTGDRSDLTGDKTMVSDSPFDDEGVSVESLDEEVLSGQSTQIFFSADDPEGANEPKGPLGGMSAAPNAGYRPPPQQPYQPPMYHPPTTTPGGHGAPSHSRQPYVAPQPVASSAAYAGTLQAGGAHPPHAAYPQPTPQTRQQPVQPTFTPPPGTGTPSGIVIDPSLSVPPGAPSRSLHTMEVRAVEAPKSGAGKMIALFAIAAILMLGIGIAAAYVLAGAGQSKGTVEIRTVPPVPAMVRVDGQLRGEAPLRLENLSAGEHSIAIESVGYQTAERRVTVESGAIAMLEVALVRAEPATSVASPPVAVAEPVVAGEPEDVATAPPVAREEDREEERRAAREQAARDEDAREEAAREERRLAREADEERRRARDSESSTRMSTVEQTPTMERETTPTMRVSAEPDEPEAEPDMGPVRVAGERGTLVINSLPWARVFIDGRDSGRNTPVPSLSVPAGTRTVGLRTPDGEMHNFEVEVGAGATVRLMKRL